MIVAAVVAAAAAAVDGKSIPYLRKGPLAPFFLAYWNPPFYDLSGSITHCSASALSSSWPRVSSLAQACE